MVIKRKREKHRCSSVETTFPLTFKTQIVMTELNEVQKGGKHFTLDSKDVSVFLQLCLRLGSLHYDYPDFEAEDTNIIICGGSIGWHNKEDARTKSTRMCLQIADVVPGKGVVKIAPHIVIYRMKATCGEYEKQDKGKSYTAYIKGAIQGKDFFIDLMKYPVVPLSDKDMPLYLNTPYLDVYAKEQLESFTTEVSHGTTQVLSHYHPSGNPQ